MKEDTTELLLKIGNLEEKDNSLEEKLEYSQRKPEELRIMLFSDFSFKLRSPLNLVVGFSNLLSSEELTQEKRKEYRKN